MHKIGFGFEGLRLIDAPQPKPAVTPSVTSTARLVHRVPRAGEDLTILEERRVHIHEWLGTPTSSTEWQVNFPMDV